MMYNEFVEGTGCKRNEHNYKVFENLEIMYMNSDMTKAEIYEYGKKLVDNSKSLEEISMENKINGEINDLKKEMKELKEEIETRKFYLGIETDSYWKQEWKRDIAFKKNVIKDIRNRINSLKWVLA